jgi:hypothetical protein
MLFGVIAGVLLGVPAAAMAHGIGGRGDLPVPFLAFVIGAGVAIVISFVALTVRWHEPRLQTPDTKTVKTGSGRMRSVAKVVGLVALAATVLDGFFAPNASISIAPVLVWIYFWLVVPFASAVLGDSWRWLNPFRTIAEIINRDVPEQPEISSRIGVWPATALFVAFTWLELVSRDVSEPRTLAVTAITYTLVIIGATRVLGVESGLRSFEAFSTYNSLFGRISMLDLEPETAAAGTATTEAAKAVVGRRGWLRALPQTPLHAGLTAFVVAMIGTVSYDGLAGSEIWSDWFSGELRREAWFETIALIGSVVVIGIAYLIASKGAAVLAGSERSGWDVAQSFAHTLVPIALAYAVAHYFTLVLFEGQLLFIVASDPFGLGWNLLGTTDWSINFFLEPIVIWYIQVGVIVAGHIAGVVLAHDRAIAEFGPRMAARTQYATLVLMVLLTSLGLFLLSGG